jgi:hypothetical protein
VLAPLPSIDGRKPEFMSNDLPASRWAMLLFALVLEFSLALSLAACSTFRHHGSHEDGGEGANAYPATYKADLLAFLQTYLNDPTNVREAQIAEPILTQVNSSDRYVVCIRYNAKNSEGRYVGVRFNQLVDATGDSCKTAVYEPFPELEALKR